MIDPTVMVRTLDDALVLPARSLSVAVKFVVPINDVIGTVATPADVRFPDTFIEL